MHLRGLRDRKRLGAWCGGLVLAAGTCASGDALAADPAIPGVVSGSRLRAMFYDGGGGALRLRGWFDSELGTQCNFLRARDGQMRCLPSPLAMFADTACAMPVWRTVGCEPTPRYVTAFVPGPASVVYALGEPYTGLVRNTGLGICRDTYVRSDSRGSYYATGTEIPPERFVAVAMHEVPIEDGKLVVHTMLGADGSSQVIVEVRARSPWADAFPPGTLAYVGSGRLRVPVYHDAQGKIPHRPSWDSSWDLASACSTRVRTRPVAPSLSRMASVVSRGPR
jgi:hypothetical protein